MQHLGHLAACVAGRAGIGHRQRRLDGIGRQERVGIGFAAFGQQVEAKRVDGLCGGRRIFRGGKNRGTGEAQRGHAEGGEG